MNVSFVLPEPKSVTKGLLVVVGLLTAASLVGQISKYLLGHDHVYGLIRLFDLDGERNVPSWFSSCALIISSILLWIISITKKKERHSYATHWTALAFIFLFLSLDELAGLHEKTIHPLRNALGATGLLYWTWVVPGIALVLVLSLVFFKFLFVLPPKTRQWFLFSGIVYLTGVLGVEMISGSYAESNGVENIEYALITTLEELCEMLGVVLFIHALLSYIRDDSWHLS